MIENIVRHLAHKDDTRTPLQKIREAAHEVQRPVFFARGIILVERSRRWRRAGLAEGLLRTGKLG